MDRLGLGAGETRFLAADAFSRKTSLLSSLVALVAAAELWALRLPRAGFAGTMLRRLATELASPSSSLTEDLAMMCLLRFFSELLGISSAGFVGTMLRRRASPSSSLTDDLAMLCLRFLSELLVISSVVLGLMAGGFGLFFLGLLVVGDDDVDVVFG